jgi:hypothetical protein
MAARESPLPAATPLLRVYSLPQERVTEPLCTDSEGDTRVHAAPLSFLLFRKIREII